MSHGLENGKVRIRCNGNEMMFLQVVKPRVEDWHPGSMCLKNYGQIGGRVDLETGAEDSSISCCFLFQVINLYKKEDK